MGECERRCKVGPGGDQRPDYRVRWASPPASFETESFIQHCMPRCLVSFCGVSCLCLHLALEILGLCMTLCVFWGSEFRFSQLHGKQIIVHEGRGGERRGSLQVSQQKGKLSSAQLS